MASGLAEAGRAPATAITAAGKVHAFRAARDPDGMRVATLVAREFAVPVAELFRPDRGEADAALARQVAMYLMRVQHERLYEEIGRVFRRDRTTVSYACGLVEEMREKAAFDDRLSRLEAMLGEVADEAGGRHAAA